MLVLGATASELYPPSLVTESGNIFMDLQIFITSVCKMTLPYKIRLIKLNFLGNRYPGCMQPGMTFTIEPAICQGGQSCVILEDGWTAVTEDGGRSAQFEHTVLITNSGVEILTV